MISAHDTATSHNFARYHTATNVYTYIRTYMWHKSRLISSETGSQSPVLDSRFRILPPIRFDRRIPNDLDSRLKRSLTTLTVACAGRFRSPGHVPAIGNVPARNRRGVAAFRSSSIIKEHGRVQSENTTLAGLTLVPICRNHVQPEVCSDGKRPELKQLGGAKLAPRK